jgi:hypothetical protein
MGEGRYGGRKDRRSPPDMVGMSNLIGYDQNQFLILLKETPISSDKRSI